MPEKGFYVLHYRRVFNLGNFEAEHIELERMYPDTTPVDVAYEIIKGEVAALRKEKPTTPPPTTQSPPATEAQKSAIFAISKSKKIADAALDEMIFKTFKLHKTAELTKLQASALIDNLQKMPVNN